MIIKISQTPLGTAGFYVVVENRGRRYGTYYMTKPTTEEVKEDFKDNRNSFTHIN